MFEHFSNILNVTPCMTPSISSFQLPARCLSLSYSAPRFWPSLPPLSSASQTLQSTRVASAGGLKRQCLGLFIFSRRWTGRRLIQHLPLTTLL